MNQDIRNDFPLLQQEVDGHCIIYVDNAATTQKPQQMIDALVAFYSEYNANIHRGVYTLAEQATAMYEQARATIARWINAAKVSEIIFTPGTTAGINMVAHMLAALVQQGQEIVLSEGEHHANLLPWQELARITGARLVFIPVQADGSLNLTHLDSIITTKTAIVAVAMTSNVFGVHNDVDILIAAAKKVGAFTLLDAAQAVAHERVNVQELGCDFLLFSGHKMFGPTGIGVLYIAEHLHDVLQPYHVGGGMVYEADLHTATWLKAPQKFEAGTPPIAQAIGLAAAAHYMQNVIDFEALKQHEAALCKRLIDGLQKIKGVTVLGPQEALCVRGHMVSFIVDGVHPHDVAAYLGKHGICVRAGHHCAQPLAKKLGIPSSVRVSFAVYNTAEEVDYVLSILSTMQW